MKQCPNPNCIFYTRLEELPDAYIKCPGCGGALVAAGSPSAGKLPPRAESRRPEPLYTVAASPDFDSATHLPGIGPGLFGRSDTGPYAADPYPPYDARRDVEEDPQAFTGAQPQAQWTGASKIIAGLSSLLLVLACGIVVFLLGNRLFPQSRTITSAQATQTAISGLRPPINTPIIPLPTNTLSPVGFPTVQQPSPAVQEPTAIALAPTQAPPLPTTAVAQEATPGPTALPPRTQPPAGIANAYMSLQLQGGEPSGKVSAYNASDAFNLAVQAAFGANAVTSITTRWYGPDGAQIYEMRKAYSQPGVYYTGFTLRKSAPWTPGSYRVDIYTNDAEAPAYSVSFSVVGSR